eukprot:69919-Ditylum_brightwellii.AAC.1
MEIGWDNFLKSRVSIHWATAQTLFLKELHPTRDCDNNMAERSHFSDMEFFTKVWISRCNTLHTKANMVTMSHLDQQIRYAFHTYSHSLFKLDLLLFSTGLNE